MEDSVDLGKIYRLAHMISRDSLKNIKDEAAKASFICSISNFLVDHIRMQSHTYT